MRSLLPLLLVFIAACGEVQSIENAGPGADAETSVSADASMMNDASVTNDASASHDASTAPCPIGAVCGDNINVAFVSSTTQAPSSFANVQEADMLCNSLAGSAGLPGTFKSWLSTGEESASERIGSASGWVRYDRRPFALSKADLLDATIVHPLNTDEQGQLVNGLVATGTIAEGGAAPTRCAGFGGSGGLVRVGRTVSAGINWTSERARGCDDAELHIYCLGVDHDAPLSRPNALGRTAWVSASAVSGDASLAGMDALCMEEAQNQGRSAAKALVSTQARAASVRFDLDGPTWVRPDGVVLWARAEDMASSKGALAALSIAGNGFPTSFDGVWTGSSAPNLAADSAGRSSNCHDWSSTAGPVLSRGTVGGTRRNGPEYYAQVSQRCDIELPVYCLEE